MHACMHMERETAGDSVVTKAKSKRRKHVLRKRVAYGATATFFVVCFLIYLLYSPNQTEVDGTSERKAAIVDHLSISQPNQTFFLESRAVLEAAGFHVYYYGGGVVTVRFYRNLPRQGFELIIFRVHSSANCTEEYKPGDYVVFFTCEKYSATRYIGEQLSNQLFIARFPLDQQEYFGITPLFVKDSMKGKFRNTMILMMGCDGLKYTSMAEAFIGRGAEVYVGWDGPVSATHTDQATMRLLQSLVTENQTMRQAVAETMSQVGQDPTYMSALYFYPVTAGNIVISSSALDVAQTNALVCAELRKKRQIFFI